MLSLLSISLLLLPLPTPTTPSPIAAMACALALLHGGALTFFVVVSHRKEERKGNAVEEVEMERMSRWERCRTSVVLRVLCISIQQHMACQRTARLVMVIPLPAHPPAVHGCCAWLLCMAAVHGCCAWLLSLSST